VSICARAVGHRTRNRGDGATAVLASAAGYFLSRGMMPHPPGLPTLRAFQAAQAVPALVWLRERLA
jgi:hypothetical protein